MRLPLTNYCTIIYPFRGQYYYRFGSIHANIIGLEVVLPNGTILDLMSTNRKDNTGYDLKHLFVGSEGTLGVVTKVALNCPSLPSARNVAFLACNSFESVCQTLSFAKEELGEVLAAFEFMDKQVLDQVATEKTIPLKIRNENYNFCVLVETQGSNREHDTAKLESFLEQVMDSGHVVDGILAQDTKQVSIILYQCMVYNFEILILCSRPSIVIYVKFIIFSQCTFISISFLIE